MQLEYSWMMSMKIDFNAKTEMLYLLDIATFRGAALIPKFRFPSANSFQSSNRLCQH